MLKRKLGLAVLLAASFAMAGCSVDKIALIDAVVASAEGVIAAISPADAALATPYLNAVLTITDDVVSCGLTAACIAKAVSDLAAVPLPVSPRIQGILAAVTKAVADLIKAFGPAPTPAAVTAKIGSKPISPADQVKLNALHERIKVAELKLKARH